MLTLGDHAPQFGAELGRSGMAFGEHILCGSRTDQCQARGGVLLGKVPPSDL